ncbi:13483_t:CDS:1, partial [Funneliformis mosseae]
PLFLDLKIQEENSKMATSYNLISLDILEVDPQDILVILLPYNDDDHSESKLKSTYQRMVRSAKLHQRIPTLTYVYYLEMLIDSHEILKDIIRKIITPYYRIAAERTYFIFENNISQIYRSKFTTLFLIERLKMAKYQLLCQPF